MTTAGPETQISVDFFKAIISKFHEISRNFEVLRKKSQMCPAGGSSLEGEAPRGALQKGQFEKTKRSKNIFKSSKTSGNSDKFHFLRSAFAINIWPNRQKHVKFLTFLSKTKLNERFYKPIFKAISQSLFSCTENVEYSFTKISIKISLQRPSIFSNLISVIQFCCQYPPEALYNSALWQLDWIVSFGDDTMP